MLILDLSFELCDTKVRNCSAISEVCFRGRPRGSRSGMQKMKKRDPHVQQNRMECQAKIETQLLNQ